MRRSRLSRKGKMKKIPVNIEYVDELLSNVKLRKPCSVCKNTLQEMKGWSKSEMKREGY